MPYAAQSDLLERFGEDEIRQLTDRALPALGAIDGAVLTRALTDADSVINRNLGGRYAVPLTAPYPTDLVRIACDLARYFLYDMMPPELVRTHYEDALAWLRAVAEGKLPLLLDSGALVAARTSGFSTSAVAGYPASATYGAVFASSWAP